MKKLDLSQQGYITTLGNITIETLVRDGLYRTDTDVAKYGLQRLADNKGLTVYRTNDGLAIDIKEHGQHLILGTRNYGDPVTAHVWLCIADAVANFLGGEFEPDEFVASDELKKEAREFIDGFLSHLAKLAGV